MPTLYASGSIEIHINLPDDEDNEFIFNEWTDVELASKRSEFGRPNVGVWLQSENDNDPLEPFVIPINENDAYEGALISKNNGRDFLIQLNGKFKTNVTKETKAAFGEGKKFRISAVSINGQSYDVENDLALEINIQEKKI